MHREKVVSISWGTKSSLAAPNSQALNWLMVSKTDKVSEAMELTM